MLFGKDGLTFDGNRALIGLLEQSAAKTGNKKRYIYTSGLHLIPNSAQLNWCVSAGVLVYPDTHNKVLDETDATESAGPLKFRAAFEQCAQRLACSAVALRTRFCEQGSDSQHQD